MSVENWEKGQHELPTHRRGSPGHARGIMLKHWRYLKYVVRHKWFVFVAGLKVRAPIWRLIIHDWSKFLPSEWFPYVENFYGTRKSTEGLDAISEFGLAELAPWGYFVRDRFDEAWLRHQQRNKHHWQHWILRNDDGTEQLCRMPEKYMREMVADWAGAGRAITGYWDLSDWYEKNKATIRVRDEQGLVPTLVAHVSGVAKSVQRAADN